jgi:multiple sugar transport system ATP-binding protein
VATLELEHVVKTFHDSTVIHGVDLSVRDGEFVVFVGPSGCGKSTLLRIISGLEPATSGRLLIDGHDVTQVAASRRGCAMVFQSYALYPHMSVYDNMAFGLENQGLDKALIDTKVQAAATQLRLQALLTRKPTQLSGGQRQRVAIGRAIVREPKLFLFDEPLSNLDAELRVTMRAEIRELHARLGATMVYVTHDQVEAMTLADRIVVLRGGVIEQVGTPLELYNQPCNTFVAGFIGSPRMNFLPVAMASSSAPGTVTVGVRPEHARLGGDIGLPMQVRRVEQMGASSLLQGQLADDVGFEVLLNGQTQVKEGDRVHLEWRREDQHGFDAQGLRVITNP